MSTVTAADLTAIVEWEGKRTRLVKLIGLPTRGAGYKRISKRHVQYAVIHQSDGPFTRGVKAPLGIARFHTADPVYKRDASGKLVYRKVRGKLKPWWIGGGRAWPGAGYTFCVPAFPDVVDGKFVVYRLHDDDVWSWHTGAAYNKHGVGICVAGMYRSRHDPNNDDAHIGPDPTAMVALEELTLDYLLPRYGIEQADLLGHFDAGKAACPGDFLEQWVRHVRGEEFPHPSTELVIGEPERAPAAGELFAGPLKSSKQRQAALHALGYDLGPAGVDGVWGNDSKAALLAFQGNEGLVVDGRWGPKTEAAIRRALAENAGG